MYGSLQALCWDAKRSKSLPSVKLTLTFEGVVFAVTRTPPVLIPARVLHCEGLFSFRGLCEGSSLYLTDFAGKRRCFLTCLVFVCKER